MNRPDAGPQSAPTGPSGYWVLLAVLVLAPAVLVAWGITTVVLRRSACRWWLLALGAATTLALVVVVEGGPERAAAAHFAGLLWLARQYGRPVIHLPTAGAVLWPTLPLSLPVGVLAGSVQHAVARPTDVLELAGKRDLAKQHQRTARKAATLAGRPERAPSDALGRWISGDLDRWHRDKYLVLPADVAGLPRLFVGASGSGKSVLLAREAYVAAGQGRQVAAIDCKGDPGFADAIVAAVLAAKPDARVLRWPAEPLNGWTGDPSAVLGRLLTVWTFPGLAAYYGEVAETVLRLALFAPGLPPVTSSRELMSRLQGERLAELWTSDREMSSLLKRLDRSNKLADVELRVLNLLSSLGGALDGLRSWEDADVVVCSLPVMANPSDADAAVRVLLADLAHYVAVRKPHGRPLTAIVDEFSAVAGGRGSVIHLAERGRSHATACLLAVQSPAGLGEPADAERLLGTSAAVTLLRSPTGDEVAKLAGSILAAEYTWQVEDGRPTGRATGTLRHAHRLDMAAVRALRPGQAAVIADGLAGLAHILRTPPAAEPVAALPAPEVGPGPSDGSAS